MTTETGFRLEVEVLSETELRMVRRFAAPRTLVFRAFTEPELIARWWGRTGSRTEVDALDLRPGGRWRFIEHQANGSSHPFRGEFLEITPPSRLVQTFEYEPAAGEIVTETMVFTEVDGVTTVMTVSRFGSAGTLQAMAGEGMADGAAETYDRLEAFLPELVAADDASNEVTLRRFYRAPRELVFAAWTEARHLDCWWGPAGFTTTTHELDARTGGHWRYTMTAPDGTTFPNYTWYDEVSAPERIVYRHGAGPDDETNAFHVMATFERLGEYTAMTARMVFPSVEALRRVKAFGAVEKGYETHGKLEAYLRELV